MIEERCPCHLHRLLARYEEGEPAIKLLASKAAVTMRGYGPIKPGPMNVAVEPGSAKCTRRYCRLLRRN